MCPKSFAVGAFSAVLAFLSGVGLAHAECDRGSRESAGWDAAEGAVRGYRCEVIELENGYFEAQCDDPSDPEVVACEAFAAMYGVGDQDAAYEDCMTVALHTPGAVRP